MKKVILTNLLLIIIAFQINSQTPWVRISPKPIESSLKEITLIPGTDRMMAIGSGATLLYTDDMGENWHISYKPAEIGRATTLNAIHFIDSNIGYIVGNQSTILKTTNGGMNWVDISLEGNQAILDVFFLSESIGIITKIESIWKTINGGQSWDSVSAEGILNKPQHLHFIDDTIGYIANEWGPKYFKTTNAGDTWKQVEINPPIENFYVTTVQYLNQDTGFVSGSAFSGSNYQYIILKTFDGGVSWIEVNNHPFIATQMLYFFDELIGFSVGQYFYENMILRTTDGGNTWQETNMAGSALYLNSFIFTNDGTGFCVGDRGYILVSYDWGANWENLNEYQCHASIINDTQIVGDSLVYLASKSYGGGVLTGGVYKSNDTGDSWNSVLALWPMTDIFFVNPLYGFACGSNYGEVYKTIDGGESWSTHEIDFFDLTATSLYFINEQVGFVGGENSGCQIHKTIDGGITWYTTIEYPQMLSEIEDIEFISDSIGFAVGPYWPNNVLLKTYDQGETWIRIPFGDQYYGHMIYFINDSVGFIICNGNKILKTVDGGNNWYEVPSGIIGSANFNDINFPSNQVGYITLSGNETQVIKTTDGGETWFPIDFPCTATPTTVSFFNEDKGLVMGDGGIIFKTYSGGMVNVPEFPEKINNESNLYLYPNPVKNLLNIVLNQDDKSSVDLLLVYDNYGRIIKRIRSPEIEETIIVDVSGWNSGLYLIISVTDGKLIRKGKFVKVK